VEVTPTRPYGGTVVWEWHLWDHLVQTNDATKNNYAVSISEHPELINVNGTGIKIPQFWNHVNGIDHNPQLDQVMLSIRGNSELFIIDHQTTTAQAASHTGGRYNKGGDILYRWGNPAQYNRGTAGNQQLYQQHHTHWIETNCPGAGNILIFNNGIGRGYSTINEIVPPVDGAGVYSISPGAAFGPSSPTWTYMSSPSSNFYSAEISGAQRLPNSNTLICEGIKGNLFEVTSAGQTVWRYLCPVTSTILTQGDTIPVDPARPDQLMNAVFRVTRYATNYAGLIGHDLTPQGTIELQTGFPVASFSGTPTNGVAPLTVTFTDTSTGLITNRFWIFGDGTTTNTTGTSRVHTYTTAGTNSVSLIATGPNGVSTNTRANYITVIQTYTLTYHAGPGGTLSGISTQTVAAGGSGTPVTAVTNIGYRFVSWSDGKTNNPRTDVNVTTNIVVTASFVEDSPVATFTAVPTNGAAPLEVTFTDASTGNITNHFWSFGDGTVTNTIATHLSHAYRFPGTNTVQLIVSGPLGLSTNTQASLITAASVDAVGDGIPDWWRAQFFGGSGRTTNASSCATCDPDGDSFVNQREYMADTDPGDPTSFLRIHSINVNPGSAGLTWIGGTSAWQYVECRTNLANTNVSWITLYTNAPPTAVTNSIIHTGTAATSNLFYRINAQR
jgi:PKD repeat protein